MTMTQRGSWSTSAVRCASISHASPTVVAIIYGSRCNETCSSCIPNQVDRAAHHRSALVRTVHIPESARNRSYTHATYAAYFTVSCAMEPPLTFSSSGEDTDADMNELDNQSSSDDTDELRPGPTLPEVSNRPRWKVSVSSLWPQALSEPVEGRVSSPADVDLGDSGTSDRHASKEEIATHAGKKVGEAGSEHGCIGFDKVFPSCRRELLEWHPNRVFFAVANTLHDRMSAKPKVRRKLGKKTTCVLGNLTKLKNDMTTCPRDLPCQHVKDSWRGRDLYIRVVNKYTGLSVRSIRSALRDRWHNTDVAGRNAWLQLSELLKHDDMRVVSQEFQLSQDTSMSANAKPTPLGQPIEADVCIGYGVSCCFNTSLGRDDPQVIRILQAGKSGDDLIAALKTVTCYKDYMQECWQHFDQVGKKYGFPLVACGLELSENATQYGRVHLHVYMGMDVRGVFFSKNAPMGRVPMSELHFQGQPPGFVRPTNVARQSNGKIHHAVLQSYYYVAGPKKGQICCHSTAPLYKDALGRKLACMLLHISLRCSALFASTLAWPTPSPAACARVRG